MQPAVVNIVRTLVLTASVLCAQLISLFGQNRAGNGVYDVRARLIADRAVALIGGPALIVGRIALENRELGLKLQDNRRRRAAPLRRTTTPASCRLPPRGPLRLRPY